MVQEKTDLKQQLEKLKWNIVNAILEERYEFVQSTNDSVELNVEGVQCRYYFVPDHFLQGYFLGDLSWKVAPTEMELIEHILADHIPQLTECECCGQKQL